MRGRLTSTHFVGRRGELAELQLAAREAAGGRPVIVLLGGESGVGKTRLVAEFERGLSDAPELSTAPEPGGAPDLSGALVLRGESVDEGETELPYAPVLGALRPLVRERHPALEELSPGSRAQLATLIPSLGEPAPPRQGEAGQGRLFEALLELLDLLSAERPVVLILEDVHWADRSTRTFIAFLARALREERVQLLMTYRSDELHRRHALRPLLAELDRLDRARRIDLRPLDRDELAEVLRDILGEQPSPAVIERLFARSQGNPLYIEELLAAGLDGRGPTPQSLRDAFLLRIERLSEEARLAARVVAVGRRLREGTIAAIAGLDADRLQDGLREAVSANVLVVGAHGRFQFRHELLREALYDDLLPGERGELHLALAGFIEQSASIDADDEVARVTAVATHYAAAGEQASALRATVAAALAGEKIYAYGEVAQAAERAIELWPRVAETERTRELDHVGLLALAGRAHAMAGESARGEVLIKHALSELDPALDPCRYGSLVASLARIQWSSNRGREALATAHEALGMLGADGTEGERVGLLAWLARTRMLRGRYREAIDDAQEALEAAIAAGDRGAEGEALNTLGSAKISLGDLDAGVQCLHRSLEIARSQGDPEALSTAYGNLADSLRVAGRTAEALAVARDGLAATPARLTRSHDWMTLALSELAIEAGDWQLVRANPGPPASQLTGRVLILRLLRDAELALGEGDNDSAVEYLEAAQPLVHESSEPQWHGLLGALLAEQRRRYGDLDGARAAVASALDELEVCTEDVSRIARVTAIGLEVEADQAIRARDLREQANEREALARARIHSSRLKAAAESGGPVERAWFAVGAAELGRARRRNDPARWAKTAAAWDGLERPYLAAACRYRQAEALVERDDRPAAARIAGQVLEVARRLGARWLEGETQALCDRARLDLAPAPASKANQDTAPDAQATEEDPFGLTPRERQVLSLIAQGATNRQIGASLYMAEKTASVHVSRILAKLGVHSRTQAAAVAHRMHLV